MPLCMLPCCHQLEVGCKAEVAALEGLAAALGDKADKEELGRVRLGLAQAAQQVHEGRGGRGEGGWGAGCGVVSS
jgi:hypothetical protein